ncbi:hypothetical protein RYZ26_12690 [Terasakiella sp. A23]|uniref:hypothetical protein n=1 Tax=Terasakiella sp. FCG-A23 TaxID=3080561 RepID=UPI0029557C91|nr:hypothetical protein [Terasakiella sp. A23]MDV7340455.1 hypothetical protein [Terasakiella sp. A23]
MINHDIQKALSELDAGSKATRHNRYLMGALFGFALVVSGLGVGFTYKQSGPDVSTEHLSRLIVIASRTSKNDPVRLLGDVERYMGKRVHTLSGEERMAALGFLIKHIELNHNKQELITY